MSRDRRAIVVGGGIIGLSTAFRLAREQWKVTLFDPAPARGATWAAAGMLAPSAEVIPGERENFEQQRGALRAWRNFADELVDAGAFAPMMRDTGTLLVGWDASDRAYVEQFASVARDFGVDVTEVARHDHPELYDSLSPRVLDGYLLKGDGWIDPDEAVDALLQANEHLGVRVIRELVARVETSPEGVIAHGSSCTVEAEFGILATGASSLPQGAYGTHSVRPIRGITVRLQGLDRSAQPTLRAFVRGRTFYLVSHPSGYCIAGATSEERPDAHVEVGELANLLRDALDLVPSLDGAQLVETRYGLRPVSNDLDPFLEVLEGGKWIWSSGHFRHGVTMAPLASRDTLKLLASLEP
ncbi:MAG TPA: FAD-dependent oxidoreductase [Acidimicrobiales bacterium]|nr:FAD-dependent oxidoreductase [Acidimicrobiales bacterium]